MLFFVRISLLVIGKRYTLYDILACLCMTIGLIFFTLADSQVQPEFDLLGKKFPEIFRRLSEYILGVWLVCCALVADAVIGNVQEKALKEYKPSNSEMVNYLF
jgi:adenosine 3'-phospho 5'-phosphosulfate transporter B3